MNARHRPSTRFMLSSVALATACLCSSSAWALGLGRLTVQSALGEALRAEIEVTSLTAEEAASLRLRVAPPEAFRAAGLDYNPILPTARLELVQRPGGRAVVRLTSDRAVLEPFLELVMEASWASGRLVREYTMLFDPPSLRQAPAPLPASPAVMAPAPRPGAPAPAAAVPAPSPSAAPATAPFRPAGPVAPAGTGDASRVTVRPGDTLSRIATRVQHDGVSLDQMLVALFRGNPQAFVADNMNRLRSGAVLDVPAAATAASVAPQEARELILAQSQDFDAFRQRLASGTPVRPTEAPPRQMAGTVQAEVTDSRPATTQPDRLILGQGAAVTPPPAPATAPERRDSQARLAELARNVDELRRLQGEMAGGTPSAAPAGAPAEPAPGPTVVAAAPPMEPATPSVGPAAAEPPAAAPAPEPAPAPPADPAPAPAAALPAPESGSETGLIDELLAHPMLLPGAGALLVVLLGLGVWQAIRRRKSSEETSFLESKLQADSFFDGGGGQRIDTTGQSPSASTGASTSYSLNPLDAIGDVDPVAEADVYLAYGRDLQAEEILKEAMRATPERMAIRTKLLEVYAKRRDAKAFEVLATQIFGLTQGQGEDWKQAQMLGRGIDPENLLYQDGGVPPVAEDAGEAASVDPLGASTQPYAAPPTPAAFVPEAGATLQTGVDLDLDLGREEPPAPAFQTTRPGDVEATQPLATGAEMPAPGPDVDLDLDSWLERNQEPASSPEATVPMPRDSGLEFRLSELGEYGKPGSAGGLPGDEHSVLDLDDLAGGPDGPSGSDSRLGSDDLPVSASEVLEQKLELAEEFRRIGDIEGARDLLQEVVARSEGVLRNKAQGMLDALE